MSFLKPDTPAPTILAPKIEDATTTPLVMAAGRKPGNKSQQTTFLGADATPGPASGNYGGKTLLGM